MGEMMERKKWYSIIIFVLCSMVVFFRTSSATHNEDEDGPNHLRLNFYEQSCPQAEDIVAKAAISSFRNHPGIAAGIIRLAFHDCFVNGCDASILLDKTPSGEKTEKDSPINGHHMNGLDVIDQAKAMLEEECPGIVSCSDIIQFAARDSVALTGLSHYKIAGGRRDGVVSLQKDIESNMPLAFWDVQKMIQLFKRKGLNEEDLVVLLGAHSVGSAHCPTFFYRTQKHDPKLSPKLAEKIKTACDKPSIQEMLNSSLPIDPLSPDRLEPGFYNQLISGEGLIESDQALTSDPRTSQIVNKMASSKGRWREQKFPNAMIKMGKIEVKTGTEGEIRTHCRFVNGAAGDADSGSDDDHFSINLGPFGVSLPEFFQGIHH